LGIIVTVYGFKGPNCTGRNILRVDTYYYFVYINQKFLSGAWLGFQFENSAGPKGKAVKVRRIVADAVIPA